MGAFPVWHIDRWSQKQVVKTVSRIAREVRKILHDNHVISGKASYRQIGCGTEIIFNQRNGKVFWSRVILEEILDACGCQFICVSTEDQKITLLISDRRKDDHEDIKRNDC